MSVVDGVMDAQSYPLPRLTGIIETPDRWSS